MPAVRIEHEASQRGREVEEHGEEGEEGQRGGKDLGQQKAFAFKAKALRSDSGSGAPQA